MSSSILITSFEYKKPNLVPGKANADNLELPTILRDYLSLIEQK
jgi:hypothetical protein